MMARIGNVVPEALSRSDLSSVLRENMAKNPSRVDMLLGLTSQPVASPANNANELNEEDVWGSGEARSLVEESFVMVPDIGKHDASNVSVTKEVVDADPFRFVINSRRWLGREESGLSSAYTDKGRSRGFPGPFTRATVVANGAVSTGSGSSGRTPSRLIPSRDFPVPKSVAVGTSSRVFHQSAPVNVPDWSKILGSGAEKKAFKLVVSDVVPEDDEDEGRLPPHELIAKEYAKSQAATFSAGRTLKGRDLSRVRNAVWRQTGFDQ